MKTLLAFAVVTVFSQQVIASEINAVQNLFECNSTIPITWQLDNPYVVQLDPNATDTKQMKLTGDVNSPDHAADFTFHGDDYIHISYVTAPGGRPRWWPSHTVDYWTHDVFDFNFPGMTCAISNGANLKYLKLISCIENSTGNIRRSVTMARLNTPSNRNAISVVFGKIGPNDEILSQTGLVFDEDQAVKAGCKFGF